MAQGVRVHGHFGLVVAVHGLGEGIVIAVADGPDGRRGANFGEPFAVADRRGLAARIAVTAQIVVVGATTPPGHFDGVKDHLGAHV
jgi:hypothetical protein